MNSIWWKILKIFQCIALKFSLSYWKNTKKQDFTGRNSTLSFAEKLFYHFIVVTTWLQYFYIGSFLPSQQINDSYNFYNMDNVFVQTFPHYEVHDFPWTTSIQEDSAKGFLTFQEYQCRYWLYLIEMWNAQKLQ